MFERHTTADLAKVVEALSRLDEDVDDIERIEQIRLRSPAAGDYVDTTPTGHRYRSNPPDPPGTQTRDCPVCEARLRHDAGQVA